MKKNKIRMATKERIITNKSVRYFFFNDIKLKIYLISSSSPLDTQLPITRSEQCTASPKSLVNFFSYIRCIKAVKTFWTNSMVYVCIRDKFCVADPGMVGSGLKLSREAHLKTTASGPP